MKRELLLSAPTFTARLDHATTEDLVTAIACAHAVGAQGIDLFASHFCQAVTQASAPPPAADIATMVARIRDAIAMAPDIVQSDEAKQWAARFAAANLRVPVIEYASLWAGGSSAAAQREAEGLCAVARLLGASHIVAVCIDVQVDTMRAAEGLAQLADIAARDNLRICVEWLPWSGIAHIRDVRDLIARCGANNVGYLLDSLHWHYQPGGPDWETLRGIPSQQLEFVQLSDACAGDGGAPDVEPLDRRHPGDGEIDLRRLLQTLDELDAGPLVSLEVFNAPALAKQGPLAFAQDMFGAARRLAYPVSR